MSEQNSGPLNRLRYHVSGAVERGEATAIKTKYGIGTRIRLVNTGPCGRYDGTTANEGTILAWTRDEGVETYRVQFDDGIVEEHLYDDEFESIVN